MVLVLASQGFPTVWLSSEFQDRPQIALPANPSGRRENAIPFLTFWPYKAIVGERWTSWRERGDTWDLRAKKGRKGGLKPFTTQLV